MFATFRAVSPTPRKLSSLPDDILFSIIEVSTMNAVIELSRACRRLNEMITSLLYHNIDLVDQPGRAVLLFRSLIRFPRLAKYIRTYKCTIENSFGSISRNIAAEMGLPIANMQDLALRGARNLESLELEVGPTIRAEDSACMMNAFHVLVSADRIKLRKLVLHFPALVPRFSSLSSNPDGVVDRHWKPLLSQIVQAQPLLEELGILGLARRVREGESDLMRFDLAHLHTLRSDSVPLVQAVLASDPPIRSLEICNSPLSRVVGDILPRLTRSTDVEEFRWSGGGVSDSSAEMTRLSALLPNIRTLGLGFQASNDDDFDQFYKTELPKQLQAFSNLIELDLSKSETRSDFLEASALKSFADWAIAANGIQVGWPYAKGAWRASIAEFYGSHCQYLTRIVWFDGSRSYQSGGSNWLSQPGTAGQGRRFRPTLRHIRDIELNQEYHCMTYASRHKALSSLDKLVQRVGRGVSWVG